MRKLLTATTALALVSGAAFAELSMSGDAELGIDYNSEPDAGNSKHKFEHEVGIDFSGSGTTDGGLSFGGSAGFDTGDDTVNAGSVFVSGAFGKITIGDNDAADLLAGGIADVGLNGVGVDNVAEVHRGTTAAALRYDHSFGQVSIAISAGSAPGAARVMGLYEVVNDSNGVFRFTGTGSPTGAAYDAHNIVDRVADDGTAILTIDHDADETATTVDGFYLGGDDGETVMGPNATEGEPDVEVTDAASLAAFEAYRAAYSLGADGVAGGDDDVANPDNYTEHTAYVAGSGADNQYAFGMSFEASGVTVGVGYDSLKTVSAGVGFSTGDIGTNAFYVRTDGGSTGLGADVSYTIDASMLTLAYARSTDPHGVSHDGMGIHVSHDLGGGASVQAGFGQVKDINRANAGLKFSF